MFRISTGSVDRTNTRIDKYKQGSMFQNNVTYSWKFLPTKLLTFTRLSCTMVIYGIYSLARYYHKILRKDFLWLRTNNPFFGITFDKRNSSRAPCWALFLFLKSHWLFKNKKINHLHHPQWAFIIKRWFSGFHPQWLFKNKKIHHLHHP